MIPFGLLEPRVLPPPNDAPLHERAPRDELADQSEQALRGQPQHGRAHDEREIPSELGPPGGVPHDELVPNEQVPHELIGYEQVLRGQMLDVLALRELAPNEEALGGLKALRAPVQDEQAPRGGVLLSELALHERVLHEPARGELRAPHDVQQVPRVQPLNVLAPHVQAPDERRALHVLVHDEQAPRGEVLLSELILRELVLSELTGCEEAPHELTDCGVQALCATQPSLRVHE